MSRKHRHIQDISLKNGLDHKLAVDINIGLWFRTIAFTEAKLPSASSGSCGSVSVRCNRCSGYLVTQML